MASASTAICSPIRSASRRAARSRSRRSALALGAAQLGDIGEDHAELADGVARIDDRIEARPPTTGAGTTVRRHIEVDVENRLLQVERVLQEGADLQAERQEHFVRRTAKVLVDRKAGQGSERGIDPGEAQLSIEESEPDRCGRQQ